MSSFNLSAWALRHQALVLFFIIALAAAGSWAYSTLGRAEDPDFTFKVMVIRTNWPGATARDVELQITDRIEKKLQETPYFDFTGSYSRPGESVIFINLKDYTPPKEVQNIWYQVRKKVGDIRHTLPEGAQGPFFNDEFGDTFGTIYAFTADGFTHAELKKYVEYVRDELLRIPDVSKADLIGVQPEVIYIELSHRKLATLGVDPLQIISSLQSQNITSPSGLIETKTDKVFLRVSGEFDTVEQLRAQAIQAGGRLFRLADIANIYRGYVDPPTTGMRYMGQDAIGLAVSMAKGGNIINLGKALTPAMARIQAELPIGIDVHQVSDQPQVVERSINEFMKTLFEAIGIVLAVSFLSLGWRTGIVVALSIPLVLAITFVAMKIFGIDFHRISLGALIIALGLLVDDAIIAVEMMVVKMEQGWERFRAASFAYTSTAFPMLTGTLVTAAGFVPVGFAKSAAGEYTFAIFAVVTIALLVSWIVAVIFTPYLGVKLLPDFSKHAQHGDVYDRRFYRIFRSMVEWCVRFRIIVVVITLLIFVASVVGFGLVQQQFFPSSNRPELIVDLRLPEGSSIASAGEAARKMEKLLEGDANIVNYVTYVGGGSPRFYLPLDQQLPQSSFAQFVILTKGDAEREAVRSRLMGIFDNDFDNLRGRVNRLENGPPVGFPVQFRVVGPDPQEIRRIAREVQALIRANPNTRDVHLDWNELSKVVKLEIDQNKARVLGISTQTLSQILNTLMSGARVTQYRENNDLIDVLALAEKSERLNLGDLRDVYVPTGSGRFVPLSQVANIRYDFEEGVIWRRNRAPSITVRADIVAGIQAPVVSGQIDPVLDPLRAKLPPGYRIELGGAVEQSAKSQASINAVTPAMLLIMLTVLMIQLQSMQRTILVFLTAPLGLIGVTTFLLLFNVPFGFVAMLGVIALAGMIMRNSVILVDQIEQDIKAGQTRWNAIIDATVRRFRPIMLTAFAAILGMIPLSTSNFWGPMAIAIMGGLFFATMLTLLFLPALYALWFRVKRDEEPRYPVMSAAEMEAEGLDA